MDNKGQGEASSAFDRRKLRQATLILPLTGERVKRDVTLRDPNIFGSSTGNGRSNEQTPLLPKTNASPIPSRGERLKTWTKDSVKQAYEFSKGDTAKAIFKCSLAYLIATSFTFFIPVANVLGTHQDGNQLIANVVVWFDPARASGSMNLGILLGFLAFLYGAFIAFSAQGVAAAFDAAEMIVAGHVIDLLLFCWAGLGFLAWFKQYMGHPLINTASSLASLSIVTCLTKEGVVQTGDYSTYRVSQILKMLVVGICVSFVINLVVWPVSARKTLRENLMKTTDAFGDLLTTITGSFLAGSDEDLNHPIIVAASEKFKTVFSSLPAQLADARYEHHPLGTESQYHIEKRLVECVQILAQDMGGLRSAAATQFSLLAERNGATQERSTTRHSDTPGATASAAVAGPPTKPHLEHRSSDNSSTSSEEGQSPHGTSHGLNGVTTKTQTPAQVFDIFIQHLGPPMRSLTYTLREILKALPYGPDAERATGNLPRFRSSLADAVTLFNTSRREALDLLYQSKELSEASSMHIAADFEEVAASCGHFSSSLEDFAETCLHYLDILDDLELDVNERPRGRSWAWLKFWRYRWSSETKSLNTADSLPAGEGSRVHVPDAITLHIAPSTDQEKPSSRQPFPYCLYPYLTWWRREDVKFAIKVGGGASFYAMFAFIPKIKPYYDHWHLEWGLVSYMLVCSMNLGASNSTAWSRSYGTLLGAVVAIIVWIISRENAYALAFCGWLVSLVCFYFIIVLGQGPMGRFILLTYNLSVLYSYALTISDPDAPDDEKRGGIAHTIFEVALHRLVAVLLGVFGGLIVTHWIWPISARSKVKNGLSLLWLRMGLIWKRAPLLPLLEGGSLVPSYGKIETEIKLREYLDKLDAIRKSAESEFKLRGPFPSVEFDALMKSTSRMLDAFHALNVVISKDLKASPGEAEILRYTAVEGNEVAIHIGHMLSVLAASLSMEFPLNDTLPKITHVRNRYLAKIFECRHSSTMKTVPKDEDFEVVYCYALVTGQIAKEVEVSSKELEKLYAALGEKVLKLQ